MNSILAKRRAAHILTPVALACVLAACGGGSDSAPVAATTTYTGKVAATSFKADASGNPVMTPGYYAGATVFIDTNGNGAQDSGEPSATTDATGKFTLTAAVGATGQFVANIPTSATNTASGAAVPAHLILRASSAQVAAQGASAVVISALSTEVQRLVDANGTAYATEAANVATRLSGPAFNKGTATVATMDVVADPGAVTNAAEQYTLLYESNSLANRYTYATAKLDRGDKYPDALAVPGGDPRVAGAAADTRSAITYPQAQQAAFNIEGIPAYDNIFVIMEENKSTDAILGNSRAPYINKLLNTYNQLTTYYSTANPSEPNYTALGGADDWGITDDNWFGCGAIGANAPTDAAFAGGTASDGQPLPATDKLPNVGFYPQLATAGYSYTVTPLGGSATTKTVTYATSGMNASFSTTAGNTCSLAPNPASPGTNHNPQGDNLFTLISKAGLTVRTYSESMNPGLDPRSDSQAQNVAKAYSGTDLVGSNGTLADSQPYQMPPGLYKVKHGPSIAYQAARNLPDFHANNRTIFGTQYTAADWTSTSPFAKAKGGTFDTTNWNYDQFGTDLTAGDVGNINFIVPDQCDDMHGVGDDTETCNGGANSNNGQNQSVARADIYLNKVVTAIQNSALWKNPNKRVAIVVMFDEGEGTSFGSSCCGWNAGGLNSGAHPVTVSASGVATATSAPVNYTQGNNGHGNSIYAVISNQQDLGKAPSGIKDSDSYSHFAFVRTLQDMFGLADPAVDASYLNRAKYTQAFVAANITSLPEFAGSADPHFDSVRPINHAYVIPAGHQQKLDPLGILAIGAASAVPVQTGPDANQTNVWSLKK